MTIEIISRSISTKVWDRAGIELATPGIAVGHASGARHVTDCATWPGICSIKKDCNILREKSLAIYFEDSQFRRNRTFNFIVSKILC